ncbi:MAG: ATP-binding cassette domain-containing protein [Thermodesulfobacteriota bacterium]|nr:ATP-binding cassette domain-containing protein [Thermodesulfobacteriota bacterium]
MEKEAIIQVKDLSSRYGDNLILDNVSLDVLKGEILVIAGSSGCGKTTLLRHMVGLSIPVSGNILINGIDITSCDEAAFLNVLKKIGILFQSSALFGSMTVAENIALPILEYSNLPESFIQDVVRMKLCMVDLTGYEDYFPSELSGGMKKRAGLARAQALNPEILFLDEPSAGLDPIISAEIDELILHINKSIGTTIIIVTHELESIFHVARRVVMLDKKTKGIIAEGKPEYLKNHSNIPFVRQFFNRTKPS